MTKINNSFTSQTKATAKSFYNSVSNLWTEKQEGKKGILLKKDILHVGSVLQNIFQNQNEKNCIEIPRLVVVGSQSSGKSSLLNGILSFDLLPTGKNMVTRTPLHMELIPKKENIVEFGKYKQNSKWETISIINFQLPNPSEENKKKIKDEIERLTNIYAGNQSNISNNPIHMKIYAENIPNLTLIDLPGITMVACTDRGQPADIKQKIRNLIIEYIKPNKTIILAVMPARTDLEADVALDLIKEYDPNGERTMGVLTKVDLMNENTDISDYLENNVSKDLKLAYGYFAIRNRTTKESEKLSIQEGFNLEKEYFSNHRIYSNLKDKSRLGIPNMTEKISNILVEKIRESIPFVYNKINEKLQRLTKEYTTLGSPIPTSEEGQIALIHTFITEFIRSFSSILKNRGVRLDTARKLKETFINYRKSLDSINPYKNIEKNRKTIDTAIKNNVGNHMSTISPPIEVLEHCLKDPITKPFMKAYDISINCSKTICEELLKLVDLLLNKSIKRFPNLVKCIKTELNQNIISSCIGETNNKIKTIIDMEENYIWTDDVNFHKLLNGANTENNKKIEVINSLLFSYYQTYLETLKNTVPKIIMYQLVTGVEKKIMVNFYECILKIPSSELLCEENSLNTKRNNIKNEIEKLREATKLIQTI